ncbi:HAD family hydrolase [Mobilitalea sibirica]|uniref:HAD family hydrolase n=1 Tax=Mobilitalea sibirica TaxID=1462919 RepID=A0A8J7H3W4_9FIRM|nr:HAD family hydrolase [Mobilitalea sibirica]MBH1941790.1 HAD family hydrolase [Mobilitalea sibirica]
MNTFIFDLDGTLLPMNQEEFLDTYFKLLAMKSAPYGLEAQGLIKAVWVGTKAMIDNDGSMTNEQRFWDVFSGVLGEKVRKMAPVFEEFYQNEFNKAKVATKTNPIAKDCIDLLKSKGYRLALATNPVFPRVATLQRIQWAGLNQEDFEWITTYENSSYCKPNLEYYKAILREIHREPEECIMIGNDIKEDMCVKELGMETFLLKDCLINNVGEDITVYRQGDFNSLLNYIKELPDLTEVN